MPVLLVAESQKCLPPTNTEAAPEIFLHFLMWSSLVSMDFYLKVLV
jgi:hypothetical protein